MKRIIKWFFVALAVILVLKYLMVAKPVDSAWKYCISVMSGETIPNPDEKIASHYRLDQDGFQNVSSVNLKIYRYLLLRENDQIKMTVYYWQDYYDKDGLCVYRVSNGERWTFTKINGKWVLTNIKFTA